MVAASASVMSGMFSAAIFWRIDQPEFSQFCSLVRVDTIRAESWQTLHFASTSALPGPSGSLMASGFGICASGKRSGHAAGSDGPRCSTSATFILEAAPSLTAAGAEILLCIAAPTASAVYWPAGKSLASKTPPSLLTTMNVRRLSGLRSFTNAPATGFPDASFTTPLRAPAFSTAAAAGSARDKAQAAIPPFSQLVSTIVTSPFGPQKPTRKRHEPELQPS